MDFNRLPESSPFRPRMRHSPVRSDRHRALGENIVNIASDHTTGGVGVFDQVVVKQPLETIRRHSLVSSPPRKVL